MQKNVVAIVIVYFLVGCDTSIKRPSAEVTPAETASVSKAAPIGLMDQDKIKTFSLAIQTHDEAKVREVLAAIPKNPKDRVPSDDEAVNLGLYIAALDGLSCDAKIVTFLEEDYQARVTKFKAINLMSPTKVDSNTPLCKDVMARSLSKMSDISTAIVDTNNHYVGLLKLVAEKDFEPKVSAYNKLLVEASTLIAASCKRSGTEPTCAMKKAYLDFANKTKNAASKALKKNSKDVLEVLKYSTQKISL